MNLTNNEIKHIKSLYQAKYRKLVNKFIVEGPHLVTEAKMYGEVLEIFTIDPTLDGKLISENEMKRICSTDTVVKQIAICKYINHQELSNRILLLDRIQDPGNMGTIMRTAVAFGFNTLVLNKGCVDIYNDKVIRSSQGAIFKLNYIYSDIVDFIKEHDTYDIYGTDVVNGIDVKDVSKSQNLGVVLGNEGQGMSKEIANICKKNIYIKTTNTESLNVSIAGAIIMYELK